ncbi:hypothetical protein [Mycobacterium intracellulare]|uniref:hypothetical protein n=1 Tax=Mycobacterium intracellulare TaxID=1767 RepID=UPI001915E077|nr:hypothetical protein [Mycobacterium intracellulare]MCA2359576.1 hypothetical protein [Mycobacterium intracellulare]MCA2369474.1 hypothetical protein [Mycobacterium intracellulare]
MGPPEPPDPEDPDGPLTPRKISESEYMSVEWPPEEGAPTTAPSIQFLLKITKRTVDISTDIVELKTMPVENTIHPRELAFDPPLEQFGKDGAKGFRHYWEMLDYVFALPDPGAFPQISLQGDDRDSALRFIEMSARLAGFSVINDDTTLSVGTKKGTDDWHVRVVDPPSDESFLGASAAFRQLHNDGEPACFTTICNTLFRVMKSLPEEQQAAIKETVPQWRSARGKLMNHTVQTLTALKAANATLDNPVSYGNINPDELIRTFNYGDSLHFGSAKDNLDNLLADPFHEAYYKYGALISIVGLSHLYFGFAVLLASALGVPLPTR